MTEICVQSPFNNPEYQLKEICDKRKEDSEQRLREAKANLEFTNRPFSFDTEHGGGMVSNETDVIEKGGIDMIPGLDDEEVRPTHPSLSQSTKPESNPNHLERT